MRTLRAAALAASTLLLSCDAFALSFDERWKSLFSDSEVASDAVSAKAEMVRNVERPERAERSSRRASRREARRHRASHRSSYASRRGERHREWYKGGKKWHYVYARKRRG